MDPEPVNEPRRVGLLWSAVETPVGAANAVRLAFWAVVFLITATLLKALFLGVERLTENNFGVSVDLLMFAATAVGLWRNSRTAAWAALALHLAELLIGLFKHMPIGSPIMHGLLLLVFVNGVRGAEALSRMTDDAVAPLTVRRRLWFWLSIRTLDDAKLALSIGSWAAMFCAAITACLAILAERGNAYALSLHASGWILIDAVLFAALGLGLRSGSLVAAWGALFFYVAERCWSLIDRGDFGPPVWVVVALLAFVTAVRGAYALRRFPPEAGAGEVAIQELRGRAVLRFSVGAACVFAVAAALYTGIGVVRTRNAIDEILRTDSLYVVIAADNPGTESALREALWRDTRARGATSNRSAFGTVLGPMWPRYASKAPDGPVVRFAGTMLDVMEDLYLRDPEACYSFLFPNVSPGALPKVQSSEDIATAMRELVVEAHYRPTSVPSENDVTETLGWVNEGLVEIHGEDAYLLARADSLGVDKVKVCQVAITMYTLILTLDEEKAGPLLRYLFSTSSK